MNVTQNTTSFPIGNLTGYVSTVFQTTDNEEDDDDLLGWGLESGLTLTLLYMAINMVIIVVILIMAARRSTFEVKQAREKKRANRAKLQQQQQVHDESKQDPNGSGGNLHEPKHYAVELTAADNMSVASGNSSFYDDPPPRKKDVNEELQRIHGVSSMGKVATAKVCCGAFIADIMNRSFIYSAFLVHIWDQGSDLGVIYTFWTTTSSVNENVYPWRYLAWISVFVLINYRIFSAATLRKAQRGWRDTILQSLDLQLFVDVYRSSVEVKPTDSLYWIRAMEAVLESCPQILLQFVFLYDVDDILVYFSLFGSLASVIFSLLHYTDVVFVFEENEDEDVSMLTSIWLSAKWYIAYMSRFLFRACEVTSRCMVLALIWSIWNSHDQTDKTGAMIVALILGVELLFYAMLTQMRIPPWEIVSFIMVNMDLTLTFEGREGALTKPLRHNPFYVCLCKPVAEMFTKVTHETENYYIEHARAGTHVHQKQKWDPNAKHNHHKHGRQKLLIAPAHYVWRFLESVFQLFTIVTYAVVSTDIQDRLFGANSWIISIATLTTVLTPLLYCTVRAFADETKTLERNLIAMVLTDVNMEDNKEIFRLIGSGASLTQTDYLGNSIVHACILKNNYELLKRLIRKSKKNSKKRRVPLDKRNKKGYTPALLAAKEGSLDCLKLLAFEDEIDLNQQHIHTGQSLVHIAAEFDQDETVEYLATLGEKNCSLHVKYDYVTSSGHKIPGYNACHVAARHNSVRAMKTLIQKGVDYKARLGNNDTVAIIAASRGHSIILDVLFQAGYNFNARGNFGHTALYRAAINDHPGTVYVLGSEFGADPNIPDQKNVPITVQCLKSYKYSALGKLASLGCRFDSCGKLLEIENDDKLTPLMWACQQNKPKLVKTLLDSGVDKNHLNKFEETAAHYAAAFGSLPCLKLLCQYNANVLLANSARKTPKEKAAEMGHQNILQFFDWYEKHQKK